MSRFVSLLFVVLLAGVGAPVQAQQPAPGSEGPPRDSTLGAPTSETAPAGSARKDPGRATLYSVGGTLLLAPVFGAGLIVGPAFGHFYADNSGQAWNGIAIRGGAAATPVVLGALATAGSDEPGAAYAGMGVFLVSGALAVLVIAGSAIYDVVTADDAARAYNRSQNVRTRVTPTVGGPQGEQVGLSVTLQF